MTEQPRIRRCSSGESQRIQSVINAGAEAYRGVIPEDCWHDPYMGSEELQSEIEEGVEFWGAYCDDQLVGVMGLQEVGARVCLIRHAYLEPAWQRRGIGSALLLHHVSRTTRPLLIGTWKAATWAIRFYEKHGFQRVPADRTLETLARFWNVPQRQAEESVVLADRGWFRAVEAADG